MIEQILNDPFWKAMVAILIAVGGVMLYSLPKVWRDDHQASGRK